MKKERIEIENNINKIKLDNGDDFEKISPFRHLIDLFWIPFLNHLPENFGDRFIRKSKDAGLVKNFATTHKALEILYKSDNKIRFKKEIKNYFIRFIDAVFTWVWFNLHHVKSVRNRLKVVKHELKRIVKNFKSGIKQTVIVSLGTGSARSVLEVVKELNGDSINTKIVLIDKNQEALDYSRKLAEEFNISNKVEYNLDRVENLSKFYENNGSYPDIIEMVGLGDYFNDEKLIKFFKIVFANLKPNGHFIVSNVIPNKEKTFIENVINWRGMYYRQPEEFKSLLTQSGFKDFNIRLIIEPIKIHTIIIAQKV